MADLKLMGTLNLVGNLKLNPNGGKVWINGVEALVEASPPGSPHHGTAPPVILPPPPAAPVDVGPKVWVVNSFSKTVTAGRQNTPIVALGMVMQGLPTWPGSLLPSQNTTVKVNFIPINVKGDQAIIFPSGGTATMSDNSGQS